MKNLLSTCLLALELLTAATALKVVKMPIAKRHRDGVLDKRQIQSTIGNYGLGYYINVTIGSSPGQLVSLVLDTGSSDLWVFGPQTQCSPAGSCGGGVYDSSQSTSFSLISAGTFSIQYGTAGSNVTGDSFTDDVQIGDNPITIKGLQMAVATQATNVPLGIMGIGFDTFEAVAGQGGQPYLNLPDALVNEGLINTRAYSLYLDDQESSTGSIIFGGFDTAKFTGQLSALPIIPDANNVVEEMLVPLTDLQLNDPTSGAIPLLSAAVPALLDSGTTLSYLPQDTFATLVQITGAVEDPNYGWILPCSESSYTGTLDYFFGGQGGPTVSVPFSEVVNPLFDTSGNPVTDTQGNAICQFGINPQSSDGPVVLGDTFLRSAYVLYDLDSQLIALAQTVFNSGSSQIVELGASQQGIVVASSGAAGGTGSAPTATQVGLAASGPALTETATQRVGPQTTPSGGGTVAVSLTAGGVQTAGLGTLKATKTQSVGGAGGTSATGTTPAAVATATKNAATRGMLSPIGAVEALAVMGGIFLALV